MASALDWSNTMPSLWVWAAPKTKTTRVDGFACATGTPGPPIGYGLPSGYALARLGAIVHQCPRLTNMDRASATSSPSILAVTPMALHALIGVHLMT